jgi:hypothetical protein
VYATLHPFFALPPSDSINSQTRACSSYSRTRSYEKNIFVGYRTNTFISPYRMARCRFASLTLHVPTSPGLKLCALPGTISYGSAGVVSRGWNTSARGPFSFRGSYMRGTITLLRILNGVSQQFLFNTDPFDGNGKGRRPTRA